MKKILSIFLIACMLLAMSVVAFAADDGTNAELEAQGYKPISTEDELQSRANGKNYYLTNDIVVKDGKGGNLTDAIIDGNGHTITFEGGYNLINWGSNLEIRNMNLEGAITFTDWDADDGDSVHYGAIVMHGINNKAIVQNINANLDITVDSEGNSGGTPVGSNRGAIGGLFGKFDQNGTIMENISFSGSLTVSGKMINASENYMTVGGVAGWGAGEITVTNVRCDATIVNNATGVSSLGGVFGKNGNGVYTNCSFDGSLTNNGEVTIAMGGFVGQLEASPTFIGVTNSGEVKNLSTTSLVPTGGICGYYNGNKVSATFEKVVNTGKVTGTAGAAGIIAELSCGVEVAEELPGFTFTAVRNAGEISAPIYAGGIIGELRAPAADCVITIEKTINVGKITATSDEATGVAGIIAIAPAAIDGGSFSFAVSNVFNTGALQGANLTPLMKIDENWLVGVAENNYYTNVVSGEHFGEKEDATVIIELVQDINFVNVDKYALTVALRALDGKAEADYTAETWKALTDAIAEGEALLETGTQEQVDAATKKINDAAAALTFKPLDTEALEALVAAVEALNEDDYRGDTWRNITRVLKKLDPAPTKQSEIDALIVELQNAIDGLIKKDVASETTDPGAQETTAPEAQETTAPQAETTAPATTDDNKGCGGAITATAVVLTAVLALGAGVACKKRED